MAALDLTGQRFGLLIAVERAPNQNGRTMWCCECDCGGEKVVRADNLRGGRTKSCGCISGPLTKEEWISRAKQKHGNKYDYSKVDYQGAHKDVEIICPIHNVFSQVASRHVSGSGCSKCGDERAAAKKRKSTADWVKGFQKVHGDRYSYPDFQIKNGKEKINIICRNHDPFEQTATAHQSGSGCPDCGNETTSRKARETRGLTQDEWIAKAIEVHGDFYDYSKVDYQGTDEHVTIICPLHGERPQWPLSHVKGKVLQCCAGQKISKGKRWSQEEWLAKAREVHGDFYDYSLADYRGSWEEVQIICPIHGEFPQKAAAHSTMKHDCPKCGRIKQAASQTYTQEDFLRLAGEVHGDKYDYSKSEYQPRIGGDQEAITIICKKHGPFLQKAQIHLRGAGCQSCKQELIKEILTKSQDQFIAEARKIHGDRYDYSRVEYSGAKNNVEIVCRDHGPFHLTPDSHLNAESGCPRCIESKGEKGVAEFLEAIEVEFETQKRFPDCKHKRRLPFDFYLPDYDALIEFDGQQHFEPDYSWIKDPVLSQNNLEMIQIRDGIKDEWAKSKNIPFFRIRFDEDLQERMCDICKELDIQI